VFDMLEAFDEKLRLSKSNKIALNVINSIIEEYVQQGYKLTLRQLYYQLVSRDIIPNKQPEYAKLSNLLKKGRMAGVIDWDAIEDRIRVPKLPYYVFGIDDAIDDTINYYRLDRMEGQKKYIEVWVEKDALSNVLSRVTEQYHIRLIVSRGYNSVTAIYDAYKRIKRNLATDKESALILYLGDHDPSGLDMVRDVQDRISFMLKKLPEHMRNFKVKQIALTDAQIKKYNPPPNPAKMTDPRSQWYLEKYGDTSWEVDALKPDVLHKLLEKEIKKNIDFETFQNVLYREEMDKKKLESIKNA
jgi:hypothetical protein